MIADAIERKRIPGAVVLVARHGKIAYRKAFGAKALEPAVEPMTLDTRFDMASLTKPIATATAAMILIEQGKLRLGEPITAHLPEFDNHGKGAITIERLLRHRSGFVPDNPLADYAMGAEQAWVNLSQLAPRDPPGEGFVYSDVNFIVLGRVIERISGEGLDTFCARSIFEPLGMKDSGFRPIGKSDPSAAEIARIAPSEREGGAPLRGVVHDPRSRALGGVAGHAGLFSTADDVALFAHMLLNGGVASSGKRILGPLAVRAMISAGETPAGERRGLGWDVDTGFSAPRGALFGKSGFGHTGFTGTSLWADLESETIVVLLACRVHPTERPNINDLRARVADLVAASIVDVSIVPAGDSAVSGGGGGGGAARSVAADQGAVDCGIDVLVKRGCDELKGKRIGLVTNQTGRTRSGKSTIDALFNAPGVKLVALFCPEHGIRGTADEPVESGLDSATGLPIVSLYGKDKKPTPESLKGIDALVFDIQDIGARFYTFMTTLGYVLEAAGENKIPLYVLDRPNPIGGLAVAGPVRDDAFASFIAYHALPVRHGMTAGELATLYNAERKIGADLKVIQCEGWRRSRLYDATGLVWVNPSPNIRSLTEALLYPGVCLLEACDLAHGRGTDFPFERVGAPFINAGEFTAALNALRLPGVRFVPIRFTPSARQFAGKECSGAQIVVTDWSRIDPVDVGLGIAVVLQSQYPGQWGGEKLIRLVADRKTCDAVLAGKSLEEVKATYRDELDAFRSLRAKYLLYR